MANAPTGNVPTYEDFARREERRRSISLAEKNERLAEALTQAKARLVQMQEIVDACARPPATLSLLLGVDPEAGEVEVWMSGKRMRLALAADVDPDTLRVGQYVRVSDQMVAVAPAGDVPAGEIVSVVEVTADHRVLVQSGQMSTLALQLADTLVGEVDAGDSLLANPAAGIAFEKIVRSDVEQLLTPEVPNVSYRDIGGLADQIELIRDTVELPFAHPDLYRSYGLTPSRGILLYGPPGCGKTLIAKAIATSLGGEGGSYFLSIKGPELLSKFVGETERQIRQIFARARQLASANHPVVIFFDEMEALFRTRGSGVSSDVETMVVPQLLSEIDGVETLDNVIVIGASNREDMIDPAVLRSGRLDVRVRVDRPDISAARDIVRIHLGEGVPLDPTLVARCGGDEGARTYLVDAIVDAAWACETATQVFSLTYASGASGVVYLSDVASGAMLAGIVERAKKYAIKHTLDGDGEGLSLAHCLDSVREEIRQTSELAAAADPAEWTRAQGFRGDTVVLIEPPRQS